MTEAKSAASLEHFYRRLNARLNGEVERLPLTPAQVQAIRAEYAKGGISQAELGMKYDRCETMIGAIVKRTAYRNVK